MTRAARARMVAAVLLALLLAGCTPGFLPGVGASGGTPATAPTTSKTPDLAAARTAAGIADCAGGSGASPVAGGLPDVALECLGGGSSVRLASLRGPMVVNLWAQWCEPCRSESTYLAAFAAGQTKVAVLGIDYSDPQTGLAIEFAKETGMTYAHLVDQENTLKGPLGVTGIPYTFLIDAQGRIIARHPGQFISLENVQQWVEKGLRS
ncbi:MAG TPA: TlpA disulfide reductase family protein [Propionicimonas sp.]|uniref:TlpA family protein disulfide reductase n=1 Tax=Propionicimonas sp. TaxID=1955623 RepID=UPI002F3EB4D2